MKDIEHIENEIYYQRSKIDRVYMDAPQSEMIDGIPPIIPQYDLTNDQRRTVEAARNRIYNLENELKNLKTFMKWKSKFLAKYIRYHYAADVEGLCVPIWYAKQAYETEQRIKKILLIK